MSDLRKFLTQTAESDNSRSTATQHQNVKITAKSDNSRSTETQQNKNNKLDSHETRPYNTHDTSRQEIEIHQKEVDNIDTSFQVLEPTMKIICPVAMKNENKPQNYSSKCPICFLEAEVQNSWKNILKDEFSKEYFKKLKMSLHNFDVFYPPISQIFTFTITRFEDIKVVIIGQDPYHNPGQAMGLSFSVPENVRIPPSLRNIYLELKDDIPGFKIPKSGNLTKWAEQGVLLLNDVLTVSKNQPASHSGLGWKTFTTAILEKVNKLDNIVFMLWGGHAKQKAQFIDRKRHLVLESGHPSPFSSHLFKGNKHFSKANAYLKEHHKGEIDWCL